MLDPARLHVFSDFDGTIADPDTIEFLTHRFGGGTALHSELVGLLRDGTIGIRESLPRAFASIRASFAEIVPALVAGVRVDPTFAAFAAWCAMQQVPLTVLSGGFVEIIELFVPADRFPEVAVVANTLRAGSWECVFRDESPAGHDKRTALHEARRAGRQTVFIGDGLSDYDPAGVADLVFAKRGRNLAAYCRSRGIPHEEYDSFADVLRRLETRLTRRGTA